MTKHLVAAALLVAAVALPAGAGDPLLAGDVCHLTSIGDPNSETGRIGEIDGGPLAAADVALVAPHLFDLVFDNPVSITLTCTLRMGGWVTHQSPALAEVSASGPVVAVVPPTPVTWDEPEFWEPAAVCTHVALTTGDGETHDLYWDFWYSEFSTDPSVGCGGPIACTTSHDCGLPIARLLEHVFVGYVDPLVCPPMAQVFPPDGDIPDVWECPPYDAAAR